jgi:hypothetical protein
MWNEIPEADVGGTSFEFLKAVLRQLNCSEMG